MPVGSSAEHKPNTLDTLGWILGWAWTVLCGGGGLWYIWNAPLQLTHGWFALLSGIAACPLTASLLRKYLGIALSGWARFAAALLIIAAGRLALLAGL